MNMSVSYQTRASRIAARCVAFHGVALTSRSASQILVHVGIFVHKPKVLSPDLNNESILVKILGQIPYTYNSILFFLLKKKYLISYALSNVS